MGHEGFASTLWRSSTPLRRLGVALLILLAGGVSVASVTISPLNATIAAWWPAAGISVIALLASRGTRLAAAGGIAAVTAAGNVIGGRELLVAVLFGIANAVEAWVVARVLSGGAPESRLDSLRDVSRLVIAAVLGSISIGLIAGATAALLRGQDFGATFLGLVASHLSALLIIVPLGLVSRRLVRLARPVEAVVQVLLLTAIIAYVFWPGNAMPTAFVPFVALLWAAFRLATLLLSIELVVLALAVIVLTSLGGGPFAVFANDGTRTTIELIQVFLIVNATAALYVSAARNDWANVVTQLEARQALLRGSIINTDTGVFIGERLDSGRIRIVGVNPVALDALGWDPMPADGENRLLTGGDGQPVIGSAEIDDLVRAGDSGRVDLVQGNRRFDVDVATYSQAGGRPIVTIIFTDVTARDRRERAAIQAADELRELNRQKDDFIASVSHELRTPVTSILGFAEQLAEAELEGDNRLAGRIIHRNARRLADVIEDVLELSSLTNAETALRPAVEVDVSRLIVECVEDATGLVSRERDVQVELHVPAEPVIVLGVEQDFSRVCSNLLSNAVKFSPAGGTVTVTLVADEQWVELRIADEGPGIPIAEQDAVWERFYRVHSARHSDVPGTGLGLPIVRTLVRQRLGGEVALLSDGEHGTTAVVRVPRRRVSAAGGERATTRAQAEGE
ncbi:ATP-binding protein [Microcella humidisoli]|uniref:histidine kinase n=1 Tax=Microcella humidisoli TaxID=2963406 RepID=A0ABY5FYP5_9MICO|nr:ATP-binding protein [Microcella humidisoli]UTT63447.1 ATP-binding protein [Microcella humidisoli]